MRTQLAYFFVENEECVGSCCSLRSGVVPMDTLFQSRRQQVECWVKNHFAQHKDEHLTRMNIFEVVSFSKCLFVVFAYRRFGRHLWWRVRPLVVCVHRISHVTSIS